MGNAREETRRIRIQQIANTIFKKKSVSKLKLLHACMLEWGTSRRTTLEYINTLIYSEKVEETVGILKWVGN